MGRPTHSCPTPRDSLGDLEGDPAPSWLHKDRGDTCAVSPTPGHPGAPSQGSAWLWPHPTSTPVTPGCGVWRLCPLCPIAQSSSHTQGSFTFPLPTFRKRAGAALGYLGGQGTARWPTDASPTWAWELSLARSYYAIRVPIFYMRGPAGRGQLLGGKATCLAQPCSGVSRAETGSPWP